MRETMNRSDIEALFSDDPGVRRDAAGKLGVRDVDLLEPEDYCIEVATRLASRGGKEALPMLHRLLGHPEPLVRANAACAVAVIDPELGVPILETLLMENDRAVRRRVMETLCRIRADGVGRLLARTLYAMYQNRRAIDPRDDWTRDLRRLMTVALGMEGESYALNSLGQAIFDGDPQVRASAAWALGEIADAAVVPVLVHALDDPDDEVRFRAASSLENLRDGRASDALLRKLGDPQPRVAAAAARSLGSLRKPEAVPELLRVIAGESDRVARAAFDALGKIGYSTSVPQLTDELASPNTDVEREVAAVSLLGLTGEGPALPPLLTALGNAAIPVRIAAVRALGRLGNRAATGYLTEVLEDEDQPREVLLAVLRALGDLGDASAVLALRAASEWPDQMLATATHRTLVRLGYARVIPEKREALPDPGRTRAPRLLLRAGRFDERL